MIPHAALFAPPPLSFSAEWEMHSLSRVTGREKASEEVRAVFVRRLSSPPSPLLKDTRGSAYCFSFYLSSEHILITTHCDNSPAQRQGIFCFI